MWSKYSDRRNSAALIDSGKTFSFWIPEVAEHSSEASTPVASPVEISKIEETFALSDDEAVFRAKIWNIMHRADRSKLGENRIRFTALRPLLRRSVELLRRYGLFIGMQSASGALFSLSETEVETFAIPMKGDPLDFYTDRGFKKFSTNLFDESTLIQLHDAVISLEKFYEAWRGTVVRPNVTVIFTFCPIFRKPSIALDGCIFIPMDALYSLQDYFFSISANEWSACQVCAQKYRHENAKHRIELENAGFEVAKMLGVHNVNFVITPGTDPYLLDEFGRELLKKQRTVFLAKEKYPALVNDQFKKHLRLRFSIFCETDTINEPLMIDDTGVMCMPLTVTMQDILKNILKYGEIAVNRHIFYAKITKMLQELRTKLRHVSFEITPALRLGNPQSYLSCFAHIVEKVKDSRSVHPLLYRCVMRDQTITMSVCGESAALRRAHGGYIIPWNISTEALVNFFQTEDSAK